jgi:hypothetical protein
MKRLLLTIVLISGRLLIGQEDRDYLTPNEVEQVRVAQDPNDRLTLYVQFARMRMDLLNQYLAKEKPGRSIFIHNTLEDYSRIIESIDSVSDDALRHHRPIDKGMVAVANAEKEFLEKLNKIQEADPKDLDRYKFVLSQAIDTTSDSRELSLQDAQKRSTELNAADAKAQKDREAMMPSKEAKERKQAAADQADQQDQQQKKIPTLLRPGEKPPPSPQQPQ